MKSMTQRPLLLLAALAAGVLALRSSASSPAAAHPAPTGETARYSIIEARNTVYFLDTKTGRLWFQFAKGSDSFEWREMETPVTKAPAQSRSGKRWKQ
jgi:hypothetical protein